MISISNTIQLQDIKIEDQPQLMTLMESIYPPVYKHLWVNEDCNFYLNSFYSLERLKLELSNPNAFYYFIFHKSSLVGIFRFVFNQPFNEFPDIKSAYLNRIYLSESAQGKGIAQQLFVWVEDKIIKNGQTQIWLKAMDSQKQALRFYEKQGYIYGSRSYLDFELMHPHFRGMHTLYKPLT